MSEINLEVKIVCVHFWFRSVNDRLKNEKHEKLTKRENSKPRGIV